MGQEHVKEPSDLSAPAAFLFRYNRHLGDIESW